MKKKALITGITGQDGAYLADFLLKRGYEVYGLYRRTSTPNFWRLQYLGILEKVKLIPGDVTDMASILEAITVSEATEIYNLAAQSFVGASFEKPIATAHVDALGVANILEAVRILNRDIKIYQASTSEIFGNVNPDELPIKEETPKNPASPYAAAKLYAYNMVKIYREAYGMFAVNGILFNHESPIRGLEFVTRKISNAVAKIKLGLQEKLSLGNIHAKRDWGYAPEYVEQMWLMLQADEPEDFVVATGEAHSVEEFLSLAFDFVGLDWQEYVEIDRRFLRPKDVDILIGDFTRAKNKLGWEPRTKFEDLVKIMVKADMERWEKYLRGEIFPWDAPNYPHEINVVSRSLRI